MRRPDSFASKLIMFRWLAGISVILLIAMIGTSTKGASALVAQPKLQSSSILFVSKEESGGATITCSDYYNGQRCSFDIPAVGNELFHGVQALFDWVGPTTPAYFVIDATAVGTFGYSGPEIDTNGQGPGYLVGIGQRVAVLQQGLVIVSGRVV